MAMLTRAAAKRSAQDNVFRSGICHFLMVVSLCITATYKAAKCMENTSTQHDAVQLTQRLEEPLAVAISNVRSADPFVSGSVSSTQG